MSSLHHYTNEELVKLKRKYDMEVSKEAIEEIKHTIDLAKEIQSLTESNNKFEIENTRLNNIIKEAREYIEENYPTSTINYQEDKYKLLGILDKVEENK